MGGSSVRSLANGVFCGSGVDVVNPAFDFVPPDLISLLLTDQGGVTPSYVYRLVSEFYAKEDMYLTEEAETHR